MVRRLPILVVLTAAFSTVCVGNEATDGRTLQCVLSSLKPNVVVLALKNVSGEETVFPPLMAAHREGDAVAVGLTGYIMLQMKNATGLDVRCICGSAKISSAGIDLPPGGVYRYTFDIRHCFAVEDSGTYYLEAVITDLPYAVLSQDKFGCPRKTSLTSNVLKLEGQIAEGRGAIVTYVAPLLVFVLAGAAFVLLRLRRRQAGREPGQKVKN